MRWAWNKAVSDMTVPEKTWYETSDFIGIISFSVQKTRQRTIFEKTIPEKDLFDKNSS